MSSRVTLKDIADMAGVSVSTVSRVLNGTSEKVARDEVKDKILEIARNYKYIPNKTAQSLQKGNVSSKIKQYKIGVIFARLDKDDYNPFFMKISRTITKEAVKAGHIVDFVILSAALRNSSAKEFFKNHPVDGVVILGKFDQWLLDKVKMNISSYIYVGLNKLLYSNLDQVVCDGYSAAVTAVNYLGDQGHKNIMYLGEVRGEGRYKGYMNTMKFLGLETPRDAIVECRFTIKSAYSAILKHYDPKYTAIFCGNDISGIGAIQALSELNYKVPDDVSVISIDDIDLIQDFTPLLTTVHIPITELGSMSLRMLLERIERVRDIPVTVQLPYQLLERQTVKSIK